MCATRLVEQKWQEWMGQREPRAPPEPHSPTADAVRVLENLDRRLANIESAPLPEPHQEELN
eukprot:8591801-Prorocentrum_lima.AAC.1